MSYCKKLKRIINEDIISELPESLLLHIISFLPTRCAVSTCLLSKRWKYLWMSTTKWEFLLGQVNHISSSRSFIDQVLRYHSSNITRFHLSINTSYFYYPDAATVKSWISAAADRQVQELHVRVSSARLVSLPLSLCNSNMLIFLSVSTVRGHLRLPAKICLSSLKILHLDDVNFLDELSFNTLFSGLPNIEELKLHCNEWHLENGIISLPTLRHLSLMFLVNNKKKDHFVKVNAENLVYLECKSNLNIDLYLDNMPSLAKGNVYVDYDDGQLQARKATNLLSGFRYAKSLEIDGRKSLEALHTVRSLSPRENLNFFPTFINLTTLKINSKVTSNAAAPFIDILRSAPILESVVIQEVYGGKWSKKPYPQCIECSLRNCSILRFGGHQANMLFVKFVLTTAKRLERLELCCTESLCGRQKKLKDIMNTLRILPRASTCCVIEFLTP